ncbi:hypothetical protein HY967_03245 [Candidatus Jorgensenbacteria bacterium]|nr:hypothetical protein [Candidatus Jorgensenbacteria bacterium]
MPVFIYDTDAFEKLVAVEGKQYQERQNDHDAYSFNAFKEKWRKLNDLNKSFTELQEFCIEIDNNSSIYGFGGWHRYLVLNTGEIIFVKASCGGGTFHQGQHTELAKKIGFRIWSTPKKHT